jgi:N-acetylmuramoyl-L-alanine amidase-like protein
MTNELSRQSQERDGAMVKWITIHTAEGPTDEFPADPKLDAGSARDLVKFFEGKTDRSCHAVCDDDELIEGLVPYDRAAWTLRAGNKYSDNLEMCGLASWSRAEWLKHPGMLDNAARWAASRCKARGIPPRRLSIGQVAARALGGVIDHNTYTKATGDGTHWDVGPNFPWDVFLPKVQEFYDGAAKVEDDDMNPQQAQEMHLTYTRASHVDEMLSENLGKILAMATTLTEIKDLLAQMTPAPQKDAA